MKFARITQALFLLNAVLWLVFGILTLYRMFSASQGTFMAIIAVLMFGDAAAMFWCSLAVGKPQTWSNILAAVILSTNIVLTITDDFGLADFLVLLLELVTLVFLFLAIKKLRSSPNP